MASTRSAFPASARTASARDASARAWRSIGASTTRCSRSRSVGREKLSRGGHAREEDIDLLSVEAAQKEFAPTGIYVNTASIGLPPRRAVDALNDAIETWRTGRAEAAGYDELVTRARQRFAALVETTPDRVTIGNQVSTFTALVASALPD